MPSAPWANPSLSGRSFAYGLPASPARVAGNLPQLPIVPLLQLSQLGGVPIDHLVECIAVRLDLSVNSQLIVQADPPARYGAALVRTEAPPPGRECLVAPWGLAGAGGTERAAGGHAHCPASRALKTPSDHSSG